MDFYPSCKIRLIVRFEEFSKDLLRERDEAPVKPAMMRRGAQDDGGGKDKLSVQPDPLSPPGVSRLVLRAGGGSSPSAGPQAKDSSGDGLTFVLGSIVPTKMAWGQNGLRTADTIKVSIRYVDCPLDPRLIRSCAVEMFLGCVDADDYADGIEGGTRRVGNALEPLNLVPDTYSDAEGNERSNLRFQGFVTLWTSKFTDGEASIDLDCIDNTQLFLDTDAGASPNLRIDPTKPLDEAIAGYLANWRKFEGLSVEYRSASPEKGGWFTGKAPVLKDSLAKTVFAPKLGPAPSKGAGAAGGQKLSIWDYLVDVCASVAHSIRIDGTVVIIQTLSNLLNDVRRRADDPFRGRRSVQGPFVYRRFIWGSNIQSLEVTRNFSGKGQPINVEVRGYDARRKKPVPVRFPDKKGRVKSALPGDGTEENWVVFKVSGVHDPRVLLEVAKSIYYGFGKNELGVEIRTKDLASFGGNSLDPDVLDLKVGDVVEMLVAKFGDEEDQNQESLSALEDSLSDEERAKQQMVERGFGADFAAAYARAYTNANFTKQFRLKRMNAVWDPDTGVELTVVGANFIEVRLGEEGFI